MKVNTVNIPKSYIELMDNMIGEDKLFLSRSEMIRVAIRENLMDDLGRFRWKKKEEEKMSNLTKGELKKSFPDVYDKIYGDEE